MFKRISSVVLIAIFTVGCNSFSTSPTSTPSQLSPTQVGTESSTPIVATSTLDYSKLTIPEMTALAETQMAAKGTPIPYASPTIELPNVQNILSQSPNGKFIISCANGYPALFKTQSYEVISQNINFSNDMDFFGLNCTSQFRWAADSSYAVGVGWNPPVTYQNEGTLKGNQVVAIWRTDGSQPKPLDIRFDKEPMYNNGCPNTVYGWSSDGQYLAAIIGCDAYLVKPFAEYGSGTAQLISEHPSSLEAFRPLYPHIMLAEYERGFGFLQIPTGKWLTGFSKFCSACCVSQLPNFSPDVRWIAQDACWMGGGGELPDKYYIINTLDASERIFSNTFDDRIEFMGWVSDSSEFLLISRPMTDEAQADPRTPFGLLALNPQTLETQMLFPQAWFAAFNKDMNWAYIAFPAKNPDGTLRLDGGLWKVGSTELLGRQTLSPSLQDNYLYPLPGNNSMYMPSGEYIGEGNPTTSHPLPAAWSYDGTHLATINAEHQLVIMTATGEIKVTTPIDSRQTWSNGLYPWSHDNTRIATLSPAQELIVIDINGNIQVIAQLDQDQSRYWIEWLEDDKTIQIGNKKWLVP